MPTATKPRIGHILWLHGSKCNSDGTYPTLNPPPFVVFNPQNCMNGRLDPVPRPTRLEKAASSSLNRWVPKWVNKVQ